MTAFDIEIMYFEYHNIITKTNHIFIKGGLFGHKFEAEGILVSKIFLSRLRNKGIRLLLSARLEVCSSSHKILIKILVMQDFPESEARIKVDQLSQKW